VSVSVLGVVLGLTAGLGALLVVDAVASPRRVHRARRGAARRLALAVASGVVVATGALIVTGVPVAAAVAGALGAALPSALTKRRWRAEQRRRLDAWPDAIDDLRSEIRAGIGMPDAMMALGRTGAAPLRPVFTVFAGEYRVTGSLHRALGAMSSHAADPVARRVAAALRLTSDAGGSELGTMLATLSGFLREDARTRSEIAARQSWTVTAARLAVAAPWLTLVVLSTRPGTAEAFRSTTGALVVLAVAGSSLVAYLMMMRLGRIPGDEGDPR